jgi:hypothetical protein
METEVRRQTEELKKTLQKDPHNWVKSQSIGH